MLRNLSSLRLSSCSLWKSRAATCEFFNLTHTPFPIPCAILQCDELGDRSERPWRINILSLLKSSFHSSSRTSPNARLFPSSQYLSSVLDLSSFPHVMNAAVETRDEDFLSQCSCVSKFFFGLVYSFAGVIWSQGAVSWHKVSLKYFMDSCCGSPSTYLI